MEDGVELLRKQEQEMGKKKACLRKIGNKEKAFLHELERLEKKKKTSL